MKAKKDHDSDEERENEEVAPPTVTEDAVKNTPISPPSQNSDANRRSERQMEVIRYSYLEDPEEGVLFEEHSVELKCPFCNTNAYSIVEYKSNILGYLVSLILLFALGWLSFWILPLVLSLTKSAVHRCSKCLNEVKNNSLLGFNSMEDKVISFNIGSFGVILSRKYLLYIVLSLTWLIVLIMLLTSGVNMNETRPITNYTWVEYKNDWGYQAFIKNPREAIP